MSHLPRAYLTLGCLLVLLAGKTLVAQTWESTLFGASWSPTPALSFETDKLIQDFSYAGYRRGEVPLPSNPPGATYNVVTGYGADATGTADSTVAIQAAINAAAGAGGGIVYLPAGTYRVSPQGAATTALSITAANIVLRGAGTNQTFILNTSTSMRSKTIISVSGPSAASWTTVQNPSTTITANLMGPTRLIPVTSTTGFSVGEYIIVRADPTDAWATEHKETDWVGQAPNYGRFLYYRQIKAIDTVNNTIEIDIPTRYYLKTRDSARVYRKTTLISEVGVENISLGNEQHSGTGWAEEDYSTPANGSYDTHDSFAIRFTRVRDGWIRNVNTFQPAGNTTTTHLLSNGILLSESSRITMMNNYFQRPQFGGGGGNGYMYRLQNASDCLLDKCTAEFSRHGFVFSHMASSGNVIYRCLDKTSGKQTGSTGNENTSGKGSDHHMHFSHSNLIDTTTADNSYFEARYRPFGTAPVLHNLTSAHGVYWNTEGKASSLTYVVHSQQSRYGYVIGTRGGVTTVKTDGTSTTKTDPVDHVEGVGLGSTLSPFSLYQEQRRRRLELPLLGAVGPFMLGFPTNSVTITVPVSFGEEPGVPEGGQLTWSQLSGPGTAVFSTTTAANTVVTFPQPGTYVLQLMAGTEGLMIEGFASTTTVTVQVSTVPQLQFELNATADAYVHGSTGNNNYGTATTLLLKNVAGTDFDRECWYRFDVSALRNLRVVSATLWLRRTQADFDAQMATYLVNDSWTETGLTWNNKPATGSLIKSWSLSSSQTDAVDVTSAVASEAAGDGVLSLINMVVSQVNGNTVYSHASREHGTADWRPKLVVTCAQLVPDFTEWMATVPGLSGAQLLPDADPDGDGRTNLEEFILNSTPDVANSTSVLRLDDVSRKLKLTVKEQLPEGMVLAVEYADGLDGVTWGLLPGTVWHSVTEPGVGRHLEADLSAAFSGNAQRFFRLRYSLQEP